MFRRVGSTLKPHIRHLHSQSSTHAQRGGLNVITLGVTAVAGTALWYFNAKNVYNDAPGPSIAPEKQNVRTPGTFGTPTNPDTIYSLVWGSNRSVF